jgi:hypothetical protein
VEKQPLQRRSLPLKRKRRRRRRNTIWLHPDEKINLSVNRAKNLKVYLDNSLIWDSTRNSFSIAGDNFQLGDQHKLTIEQFTYSGTNSLADKLNLEFTSYLDNFILKVDTNRATPQILSVSEDNGSLNIFWELYTRGDFQKYILMDDGATIFGKTSNQKQSSFTYNNYVGQPLNFRLMTNRGASCCGLYGENAGILKSTFFQYKSSYTPNFQIITNSDVYFLEWQIPAFFKNINTLKISLDGSEIGTTSNSSQTSIPLEFEPIQGQEYRFIIKFASYPDADHDNRIEENYISDKVVCCN